MIIKTKGLYGDISEITGLRSYFTLFIDTAYHRKRSEYGYRGRSC